MSSEIRQIKGEYALLLDEKTWCLLGGSLPDYGKTNGLFKTPNEGLLASLGFDFKNDKSEIEVLSYNSLGIQIKASIYGPKQTFSLDNSFKEQETIHTYDFSKNIKEVECNRFHAEDHFGRREGTCDSCHNTEVLYSEETMQKHFQKLMSETTKSKKINNTNKKQINNYK